MLYLGLATKRQFQRATRFNVEAREPQHAMNGAVDMIGNAGAATGEIEPPVNRRLQRKSGYTGAYAAREFSSAEQPLFSSLTIAGVGQPFGQAQPPSGRSSAASDYCDEPSQ